MENIHEEAILGMLSEMNTKLDKIQNNSKLHESETAKNDTNNAVSKEEIELILQSHGNHLGNSIEKTHNQEVEFYNKLITSIYDLKKQITALPIPEKLSLEPILELFPKHKKIAFFGFEFLRTSVVIFALALLSFCLFTVNIRQMDKHKALKYQLREQTEYIRQMQIEKQRPASNEQTTTKKKKK